MEYYFSFVSTGRIKIRIMFTYNINQPIGLSREQLDEKYFLLYYQFLKHAFGIKYCNPNGIDKVYFTLMPDQIPDTKNKVENFKDYISEIPHIRGMDAYNVFIPRDQIVDVDSKNHNVLQGLDVILGSMCSKLNEKLRDKADGARTRGKRTIAKERLYKHINSQIRLIRPNFNVGISTGKPNGRSDHWDHAYRHWRFVPSNSVYDPTLGKRRLAPPEPT